MKKYRPINLTKIKTYSAKKRRTRVSLANLFKEIDLSDNQAVQDTKRSKFNVQRSRLGKKRRTLNFELRTLNNQLLDVAKAIIRAHKAGKPIIWAMGAHIIKVGLSPIIIQMIREGYITCVAMNGAGAIHDFELATLGNTSEDVAENLKTGMFGMVRETLDDLNAAIKPCRNGKTGFGEAVGKYISKSKAPYKHLNILAAAYEMGIPATVHVAIGTDTIHMSPKMDAAATGLGSHYDFRLLCDVVSNLEGGVYINAGSAVILPEVFLKALTVARNLGHKVDKITTVNMDMLDHYRPRVNVVERPNLNGGKGINIIGKHEVNIPALWKLVKSKQQFHC